MDEFETITLKQFFENYKENENPLVLINLETCSPNLQIDYYQRNENVKNHRKLCDHCDGTGNDFMFMYHKCPECNGEGWINENYQNNGNERKNL